MVLEEIPLKGKRRRCWNCYDRCCGFFLSFGVEGEDVSTAFAGLLKDTIGMSQAVCQVRVIAPDGAVADEVAWRKWNRWGC